MTRSLLAERLAQRGMRRVSAGNAVTRSWKLVADHHNAFIRSNLLARRRNFTDVLARSSVQVTPLGVLRPETATPLRKPIAYAGKHVSTATRVWRSVSFGVIVCCDVFENAYMYVCKRE